MDLYIDYDDALVQPFDDEMFKKKNEDYENISGLNKDNDSVMLFEKKPYIINGRVNFLLKDIFSKDYENNKFINFIKEDTKFYKDMKLYVTRYLDDKKLEDMININCLSIKVLEKGVSNIIFDYLDDLEMNDFFIYLIHKDILLKSIWNIENLFKSKLIEFYMTHYLRFPSRNYEDDFNIYHKDFNTFKKYITPLFRSLFTKALYYKNDSIFETKFLIFMFDKFYNAFPKCISNILFESIEENIIDQKLLFHIRTKFMMK